MRSLLLIIVALSSFFCTAPVAAQYAEWTRSGSVFILTTPAGVDLPATAVVHDFPLLIRLHRDFFDFRQAKPDGADLRIATKAGLPLPYQIEEWDATVGTAAIWVRIPTIQGQTRQEVRVFWGNPAVNSESSGAAVFGESNGFVSVWHLGATVADEVGTLTSQDVGTTVVPGIIGQSRHLAGRQGVFGGDKIQNYPSGGAEHSTSAWFRAQRPNATILGWGNEGGGRGSKVRMQFRSPPHLHIDSDFSDVDAPARLPMNEWIHVVHTYANGEGRIYLNGKLAAADKPTLNIKTPSRLWLGGWYHNYDFVGDLDEVRISKVARSPDWVRLEYDNQQPLQRLVGPIVPAGDSFTVSPAQVVVAEGKSVTITAQAGGAHKLYWTLKRDGQETVVATDRLNYTFDAGRTAGNQSASLRFNAIYADGEKSIDIPITITESIPEPEFTLSGPTHWDGRQTIEVLPRVTNQSAMAHGGAGDLTYRWSVSGLAAMKEVAPGKLILKRGLNSGAMTVTLDLSNGGNLVSKSITIGVQEPASDPWIPRTADPDEKPQDNQFYARDDRNEGTLFCNGTLTDSADEVFLKLYADDKLIKTETQRPNAEKAYALSVKLQPGLIKYRVECGARNGAKETVLHTAGNLVCGDAYLIDGQSNAEATDVGKEDPAFTSDWIRSFGSPAGHPEGARLKLWTNAVCRDRQGGKGQIGYWGLELARRLVESEQMPICIINGAVGGTRIDQHQRNTAVPDDVATIYGRLLWRVRQARLMHGIRGILWHQGENDQGADGPTGGFGWETYREFFIDMAAGWQQDYPNLRQIYVFQIWPKSCSMGINGSDNKLREVQRTLPRDFSRLHVMSTLGIHPPGGCHFPPEGYTEFARMIAPLIERDHYGRKFPQSITPPNLIRAAYTTDRHDEIRLEFDQPVVWNDKLTSQFSLDGAGAVTGGSAADNSMILRLAAPSTSRKITYLDSKSWSQDNLLLGVNGIAALTFCDVQIEN